MRSSAASFVHRRLGKTRGLRGPTPRLFRGRVAVIGNTHRAATDRWRTPEGIQPGVELLADTIRFAPRQLATSQGKRVVVPDALLLFFCFLLLVLRPFPAGIATIAASVVYVWVYLALGKYRVLDELETILIAVALVAMAEELAGFLPKLVRHPLKAFLHPAEGK